jgi:hypothetical protein
VASGAEFKECRPRCLASGRVNSGLKLGELRFLLSILARNHPQIAPDVHHKNAQSNNKHECVLHRDFVLVSKKSFRRWRMAIEKARIEGTHIPTKIPESLSFSLFQSFGGNTTETT